jgi:hypothetical protein
MLEDRAHERLVPLHLKRAGLACDDDGDLTESARPEPAYRLLERGDRASRGVRQEDALRDLWQDR